MTASVQSLPAAAAVITDARGGWWHEFVCPVHHVELDHAHPGATQFTCRYGCRLTGEKYGTAWLVLEHQEHARRMRLLAHRYAQTGADDDRSACAEMLDRYAQVYARIARSQTGRTEREHAWMVRGTLFHQALTEAIWAASVADAVETLAVAAHRRTDGGTVMPKVVGLLDQVLDGIRTARHELVEVRGDLTNNYTAWFDAAGALLTRAMGACRDGAPTPQHDWLGGPHGIYSHIRAAVRPDGWEWEGSTYYHGFVLRAYLLALRGMAPADLPGDVAARIRAMLHVIAGLAADDGRLETLHDSPYRRTAQGLELAELCALGQQFFLLPDLRRVATRARAEAGAGADGLEELLDGWFGGPPLPTEPRDVTTRGRHLLFADAGYAVLHAPDRSWRAILDFGPHGGSHGHLDKLALYLHGRRTSWQPDPGVPPYASTMREGWYRTSAAHPTFTVDGADQAECSGRLERWRPGEDRVELVASADEAYPGVRARRLVAAEGHWLLDVLMLASPDEHDYVLRFCPDVPVRVTTPGPGLWVSHWDGVEPLVAVHRATVASTMTPAPSPGPADDPMRRREHLQWSSRAAAATLVTLWQPGAAETDAEVRLTSAPDAAAIEITVRGERRVVSLDPDPAGAVPR